MSVQYLLMAYNKPLGLYTSVLQTTYWKKGNTGQDTGSRFYASTRETFPSSCFILKSTTEIIQRLSISSLHFCNLEVLSERPKLQGLNSIFADTIGWP